VGYEVDHYAVRFEHCFPNPVLFDSGMNIDKNLLVGGFFLAVSLFTFEKKNTFSSNDVCLARNKKNQSSI